MVECPVGLKCKPCVRGREKDSKETLGSKYYVAKGLGASALVGLAAGWVMPFIHIPWVDCFIAFFLGIYSGRWLVNHLDRRLAGKTAMTVVFGVLFGMTLGPLHTIPVTIIMVLAMPFTGGGLTIWDALGGVVSLLFCPVCFFAGVLRPTVWGEFR
jgi:hypothetical protein